MTLRFFQVDQAVAARDDIAASAALVHGALSSLETLARGDTGFGVEDIADAMGWAPRSVQRALSQLVEVALVELVPTGDGRVRRYRTGSAPRTAGNVDTSAPRTAGRYAPRTAGTSDRCAPRTARISAPQTVEIPAAHGAHLDAAPLSSGRSDQDPYTGSAPSMVEDPSAWLARFDRHQPGALGRLAEHVQTAIGDAQVAQGAARTPLDTSSRWLRLADFVVETSMEPSRPMPLADVVRRLADGWARDGWARSAGYPIGALLANPQKYFAARRIGAAPPSRFNRPQLVAARVAADDVDADWTPEARHG